MKLTTISLTLKKILLAELKTVMSEYERFRHNLAKIATEGGNISGLLQEEVFWEQKIKQLKSILSANVVKPAHQKEAVMLGSQVTLAYSDGTKRSVIVDGYSIKYKQINIINIHSTVGKMLLGLKQGDNIYVGDKKITIIDIGYPW